MSFGKMNTPISVCSITNSKDSAGFAAKQRHPLLTCRAYKEEKNMSEKWSGSAVFSEATVLFRFRCCPGISISTRDVIVCDNVQYDIISVEDVRGRSMYYQVLAKSSEASNG